MTQSRRPLRVFLAELKRRRVVRVAIVYALAGLVVVEAANNLLPALKLPAWTVTAYDKLLAHELFIIPRLR